jgi:diguanylate cyclase (GGDEF)-like protein
MNPKTKNIPNSTSLTYLRRLRRNLIIFTLILLIIIEAYLTFFRQIPLQDTLVAWLIGFVGAFTMITLAFRNAMNLQIKLDEQLIKSQWLSRQQAAFTQINADLTTTLDEFEICNKVVDGLHKILGFTYVGILMIDKATGDQVISAHAGRPGPPPGWRIGPGNGVSELPFLDGKLHYIPDIHQDPRYVPGMTSGAEVNVPIHWGDEVIGVLVVENPEPHSFDEDDFMVLTAAAGQTAIAIQNARRLKREEIQQREAETLREATASLTSDLDLDRVLDQILVQLEKVIPFDSTCVFLREKGRLQARAARGLPNPEMVIGHHFPLGNELFDAIVDTGNPLILVDTNEDPRFKGWGGTHEMNSWMGVPLINRDTVIGFLTLDSRKIGAYDEADAALAQAFANQSSVAIENARLYNAAMEAAERRAILHRVSQEILSANFNPEQIKIALHEAAVELMPSDAFVLAVLDKSAGEIESIYLVDQDKRYYPQRVPMDRGLSAQVITNNEAIMINDFTPDVADNLEVIHFGTPDHVRAILAVPMRMGNSAIGMMATQSYQPHVYTIEDQRLLEMLAAHAAIALDNARLFNEVQHLAITDALTGVSNRRYLLEIAQYEFDQAKRYQRPLSAIMFDLDGFKNINDQFGHAAGDTVLRLVAQRCQENVRNIDTLGRYGGDEFGIILPETKYDRAHNVAERIRSCIADKPFLANGNEFQLSISMGVATISENTQDLSGLLSNVDAALYDAKESGKNRIVGREDK